MNVDSPVNMNKALPIFSPPSVTNAIIIPKLKLNYIRINQIRIQGSLIKNRSNANTAGLEYCMPCYMLFIPLMFENFCYICMPIKKIYFQL